MVVYTLAIPAARVARIRGGVLESGSIFKHLRGATMSAFPILDFHVAADAFAQKLGSGRVKAAVESVAAR